MQTSRSPFISSGASLNAFPFLRTVAMVRILRSFWDPRSMKFGVNFGCVFREVFFVVSLFLCFFFGEFALSVWGAQDGGSARDKFVFLSDSTLPVKPPSVIHSTLPALLVGEKARRRSKRRPNRKTHNKQQTANNNSSCSSSNSKNSENNYTIKLFCAVS